MFIKGKSDVVFNVSGVDGYFAIDGPEPLAVARVGCH